MNKYEKWLDENISELVMDFLTHDSPDRFSEYQYHEDIMRFYDDDEFQRFAMKIYKNGRKYCYTQSKKRKDGVVQSYRKCIKYMN